MSSPAIAFHIETFEVLEGKTPVLEAFVAEARVTNCMIFVIPFMAPT
jgi:hypothetical protein